MKQSKYKLSKKAKNIIAAFDDAAQHQGWHVLQDIGKPVKYAEADYKDTLNRLEKFVLSLEKKVRKAKV